MITTAQAVKTILYADDGALLAARRGILQLSAYARLIQSEVEKRLLKEVNESSIVTALSRIVAEVEALPPEPWSFVQSLIVHSNLEGITYERTAELTAGLRSMYREEAKNPTVFSAITQGVNEVTIIAEADLARSFRKKLKNAPKVYDKTNLVGITCKLKPGLLEVPNLIFILTRRLAYKHINLIEVVSTATELTFIIERSDLAVSLEQLQKDV